MNSYKTIFYLTIIGLSCCYHPSYAQSVKPNEQLLEEANSLYTANNWKAAKESYQRYLKDTSTNGIAWARLGYCDHNLGLYQEALANYNKGLSFPIANPFKAAIEVRVARTYAMINNPAQSLNLLDKAVADGYTNITELDTHTDFKNVRDAPHFKEIRQKVYTVVFPCSADPKDHDFDFWIGEWDVYQTGTKLQAGHSVVQSISGGCAILENWASTGLTNGKSINYYQSETNSWEQDWVGSGGDKQHYVNGEYKNGIMHFTYETTTAKGEKMTGNFMFYNIANDTVRQYQDVSNDGGKTYTVSYDFTYIRKK